MDVTKLHLYQDAENLSQGKASLGSLGVRLRLDPDTGRYEVKLPNGETVGNFSSLKQAVEAGTDAAPHAAKVERAIHSPGAPGTENVTDADTGYDRVLSAQEQQELLELDTALRERWSNARERIAPAEGRGNYAIYGTNEERKYIPFAQGNLATIKHELQRPTNELWAAWAKAKIADEITRRFGITNPQFNHGDYPISVPEARKELQRYGMTIKGLRSNGYSEVDFGGGLVRQDFLSRIMPAARAIHADRQQKAGLSPNAPAGIPFGNLDAVRKGETHDPFTRKRDREREPSQGHSLEAYAPKR